MLEFGDVIWADSSIVWSATATESLKRTMHAVETSLMSPVVLLDRTRHNVVPATNPGKSLPTRRTTHSHVYGALRVGHEDGRTRHGTRDQHVVEEDRAVHGDTDTVGVFYRLVHTYCVLCFSDL